jgi:eukaryotic-like serine/threonine-protein kinase
MSSATTPDKIGRYQILERVGRGGMGVLYRGFDPILDREVAIKVMLADFSEDTEQMRPRFYREAKAVAKLQHRNIVTIFEFAEENQQPHIVMEFLRGLPLSTRMEQKPPLTLDDKLDVVAQLCNGLGYAHTQGIVHRDVKPANVFILEDGTVKLLDFGIAKLATSTLTRQGDVVGSAPYMSPEQIAGTQDIDGRSDVWSTGVLLFELLTGKKPFDGDALTTVVMGILKNEPPPVDQLIPGMPKAVAEVVTRALHKDRDRRYQTAEELGRELQLIRKTQQLSNLPPMDATRFASTNVLKALHDDRQKQEQGAPADQTLQPAPARAAATAAQSQSKTWIIGVAAAVVIVAVGLGYAMLQSDDLAAPASGPVADGSRLATAEPISAPPAATPPPATATVPPETTSAPGAINKPTVPTVATKKSAEPPPVKKSTAPATEPAAAVSAPPPVKSAPANVAVTLSGTYPFEVWDGSRLLSGAARSHELPLQANGKTLRIVASDVFLDRQVKVDGGDDQRFDHAAPGLGRIEIRAARGECKAMVGKKDLGYGPWPPQNAVVGEHRVTLVCPDDQNPVQHVLVTQGRPARATFQAK